MKSEKPNATLFWTLLSLKALDIFKLCLNAKELSCVDVILAPATFGNARNNDNNGAFGDRD